MRIGKKVWLTGCPKADGRINVGKIVGIEHIYECLGFMTERQYLSSFVQYQYKVAFVDVATGRGVAEWVHHTKVSFNKPLKEEV
jgi:hypothetical protein